MKNVYEVKVNHTDIELEYAYNKLKEVLGKLKKTDFATIIGTSKQNIGGRMGYNGKLFYTEAAKICSYLESNRMEDTDIYKELSKIVANINNYLTINHTTEPEADDNFVELNVRGDVGLSCGYGTVVYNDGVTGKCRVPRQTLREYGASAKSTEIVYAQGDSMLPDIKSGDALLVDTSQTDVIDGVIYAFNFDGQPMCKRLQKIGKNLKAISSNPLFDPFIIDGTCQFNIVGRVVGFLRQII